MARKPKAPSASAAPKRSRAASVARGAAVAAGGVALLGTVLPGAGVVAAGLGTMALLAAKDAWKERKAAMKSNSPNISMNLAENDTARALQGVASKSAGTAAQHNEGATDANDKSVMNSILNKRMEGRLPAGQERGMSERIPHMMTPPGYNDRLRSRPGGGPKPDERSDRGGGFDAANTKFEQGAERMRQASAKSEAPSSSSGNGKRGWQNPKVQAAAQKARGANYKGPTS
jgi:hypothetical protein